MRSAPATAPRPCAARRRRPPRRPSGRPPGRGCRRRTSPTSGASGRRPRRRRGGPRPRAAAASTSRRPGRSPPRRLLLDLLQEPAVAVRGAERRERPVARVVPRRPRHPCLGAGVVEDPAGVVEDLADLDAAADELVARLIDVEHGQLESLEGAGGRSGQTLTEDDRGLRPGRRELDDPEVRARGEVGVLAPSQGGVERLGTIDVGDRDDDDLEFHGHRTGARGRGAVVARLRDAHLVPPVGMGVDLVGARSTAISLTSIVITAKLWSATPSASWRCTRRRVGKTKPSTVTWSWA